MLLFLLNTQHLLVVHEHPNCEAAATPPKQGLLQCGVKVHILQRADSRMRHLDRWVY